MRLIAQAQNGMPISADSAQHVAPLAKFHTIPVTQAAQITGQSTGHLSGQATGPIIPTPAERNISNASAVPSVQTVSSVSSRVAVPVLTPQQASSFGAMFDRTTSNKLLPGAQARDIFLKARLPVQILEKIWNLVDRKQKGELERSEFIVAMHLIQSFLGKSMTILPTTLPEAMWQVAETVPISSSKSVQASQQASPASPINPVLAVRPSPGSRQASSQSTSGNSISSGSSQISSASAATNLNTWIMSAQQKEQYGAIFNSLDKLHKGSIDGQDVAKFLMTSKLPNNVLANIWELAKVNTLEGFNRQEFSIAMYLVQKSLAGYDLPEEAPIELRQSSSSNTPISPTENVMSSASHMDDLKDIFGSSKQTSETTTPVPQQAVTSSATESGFVPSSDFGKHLQQQQQQQQQNPSVSAPPPQATVEESSSDDEEGPEDLDHPMIPPIPRRDTKPVFSSSDLSSNKQSVSSVSGFGNSPSEFTNQIAKPVERVPQTSAVPVVQSTGSSQNLSKELSKATVDVANMSNEINSLTVQSSGVTSRKGKAQKQLTHVLKVKQDIKSKLAQLKQLYQQESQKAQSTEQQLAHETSETKQLQQQVSVAEANYHSEQDLLKNTQSGLSQIQAQKSTLKQQLSTLNDETKQLEAQLSKLQTQKSQEQNKLEVVRGQVASQQSKNAQLKQQIEALTGSIQKLLSDQSSSVNTYNQLEDKSLDLQAQHTDLSADYAQKTLEHSQAVSQGLLESEVESKPVGKDIAESNSVAEQEPTQVISPNVENATNPSEESSKEEKKGEIGTHSTQDTAARAVPEKETPIPDSLKESAPVVGGKSVKSKSPESKSTEDEVGSKKSQLEFKEQSKSETESAISNAKSINPVETKSSDSKSKQPISDEDKIADHELEKPNVGTPVEAEDQLESTEVEDKDIESNSSVSIGPQHVKRLSQETVSDEGESFELLDKSAAELEATKAPETEKPIESKKEPVKEEVTKPEGSKVLEPGFSTQPSVESKGLFSSSLNSSGLVASSLSMPGGYSSIMHNVPKKSKDETSVAKEEGDTVSIDDDEGYTPANEHHLSDSDSELNSDSEDHFEDSLSSPIPAEKKKKKNSNSASTNPFLAGNSKKNDSSMFDNLGLEEAQVEDNNESQFDEFDQVDDQFTAPVGFSFSQQSQQPATASSGNGVDDWEQVFAGFGNVPADGKANSKASDGFDGFSSQAHGFSSQQSEGFSNVPSTTKKSIESDVKSEEEKAKADLSSKYSHSQKMAIDELKGMGFDEQKAVEALQTKGWNLSEATNYLLDTA